MSAMHMSIHAQDTGFIVKVGKELVPHPWDENYYYYSLDAYLKDKITSETIEKIVKHTREIMGSKRLVDFQPMGRVHSTMWVKKTQDRTETMPHTSF